MFTAEQLESAASQCGQVVRYRFGRPVISPEMAALLPSPFVERPRAGYVRPGDPEPEECSVIQPGARIGGRLDAAPDPIVLLRRDGTAPFPTEFRTDRAIAKL